MRNMGDLGLSFADVETKDLIPNGKYHVRVERFEETETQGGENPGTPMFKVGLSVVSGKYENRWVWDNLVVNKGALWKLKSFLLALGISEEEIASEDFWPDEEYAEENIISKELDVRVGRKPASGEYDEQNKVNGYAPHKFTDEDMLRA